VIREVDARNSRSEDGECRVRIHGVAFPVFWDVIGQMGTGGDYAVLMRILTMRNCVTFVALPSRRAIYKKGSDPFFVVRIRHS
jgi:hypothetical protein